MRNTGEEKSPLKGSQQPEGTKHKLGSSESESGKELIADRLGISASPVHLAGADISNGNGISVETKGHNSCHNGSDVTDANAKSSLPVNGRVQTSNLQQSPSDLRNGALNDHSAHHENGSNSSAKPQTNIGPLSAIPSSSTLTSESSSSPQTHRLNGAGVSTLTSSSHSSKFPQNDASHSFARQFSPSLEVTIPYFYAGKNVFLTGATGFIGKVFVEKLLRSCPDISGIYCLVRPKKNQTIEERIADLVDSRLFENLRKEQPNFFSKIHPVLGDVLQPNLGLSKGDLKTLQEKIHIVFHSAATVRFDEPLRTAVEMNILSVRKMISLCRSFQHLEVFVHVSTAFANCDKSYIEERIYPPPVDPQKIIDVLSWMDDEMVELFTPKLIGEKPNTYTYTKQLAEHLLVTEGSDLPLAIVRPSIVGAAWKEPFPGWIDNYNGPSGIYIAAGKGVLRWMKADHNAVADIVPVDICVNIMIAVGWYTAVAKPKSVVVYHTTNGHSNPVKWGDMESIVNNCYTQIPLENGFRRPNVAVRNFQTFDFCIMVSHMFPAYICDMAYTLIGKKPRMVKMYNKLHRSIDCLQFFTCNEWRWETTNYEMLRRQLSPEDLKAFYFDLRPLHWPTYIENYCIGAKKYILNEDLSDLPAAKAHHRKLRIIRTLFNSAVCIVLWRVLIAKSNFARNLWFFIVKLVFKFVRYFKITSTMYK